MADKVSVIFKRNHEIYNSGEVAEFEAARAKQLVHAGIVVEGTYEDTVREVEERVADRVPATIEELEAEVLAAGYSADVAKKIAQERFDGVYGDEAKFIGAEVEYLEDMTPDELRKELSGKTKAQIIAFAKDELGLELDENLKKDELIEAIIAHDASTSETK